MFLASQTTELWYLLKLSILIFLFYSEKNRGIGKGEDIGEGSESK